MRSIERWAGLLTMGLVVLALIVWLIPTYSVSAQTKAPASPPDNQAAALPKPFSLWPADKKPDAVFVLSGQTWGYLRPCGCSAKQLGGLERRKNLIDQLKAKGWPVAAVDLGDITPLTGLPEQVLLKYQAQMQSMRAMGYLAVGVGKHDFTKDLDQLTAKYSLQPGNEKPRMLAANLLRVTAKDLGTSFPTGGNDPPYIDDLLVENVGNVPVGIVGTIESTIQKGDPAKGTLDVDRPAELNKQTQQFTLLGNQVVLPKMKQKLDAHPAKPVLRVLLYQGGKESAIKVAGAFPEYQIVLCLSDDALPPLQPDQVNDGKTSIIQVGHKGQYVGVAGAFKQPDGTFKIEYQLIDLSEDYLTPKDASLEAKHDVLKILQKYADQVRDDKFLEEAATKKVQHNAQIRATGEALTYVGSKICANCHVKEFEIHSKTKHSEALKFLELPKYSNRPTQRNFDPECVVCHVVGFEHKSGYINEAKTPHLAHVGCESCHGPGSGHAKDPADKVLLGFLSPWKTKPGDKLPSKEILEDIGKTEAFKRSEKLGKLDINQTQLIMAVTKQCMTCHDTENDPKFDLYEYMPKIWHSGQKPVQSK